MTKKTLEEYQIQEIARSVFKESSSDFIYRGEYDLHVAENERNDDEPH
jgi:hypothetical protein